MREFCPVKYDQVEYKFERIDNEQLSAAVALLSRDCGAVIYGAGENGLLLYDFLESVGIAVECFCDKDVGDRVASRCGKPFVSIGELSGRYGGKTVVISENDSRREIYEALTENGVPPASIIQAPFKTVSGSIFVPADAMPDGEASPFAPSAPASEAVASQTIAAPPVVVPPVLEILRRNPATDAAPSVAVIGGGATGEPPILVCTIVYNVRPSYLRRAIESVLNQTFAQFRYLIVDNGSTDGSAGIIKEYARADSRIETLAWRTNIVGSQWAESHAKRHWKDFNDRLTAEYYCSLDSDDYYDADFLQTSYALAERFGADIVSAGALQYKEDNPRKTHYFGSPLGTRVFAGDSKMGAMLGNIHAWRPVWGKLMKTRVYTCMHGDDMKEAMSQVGNVYDVYNMFRRFRASRTVVMAEQVLCYHTYRRASVSNNLNENSNPIKRLYFLNDWLIGALRADGAETTENLDAVNGFAFKHMDYPDLDILDRAKRSNPELVRKTVRSILETPAPDNLRRDARMATVLRRLNEILATAEGCLRNPPN